MNLLSFITDNIALSLSLVLVCALFFLVFWTFNLSKTKNELKKSKDRLKLQSEVDELTGLGNRRKFYKRLHKEIENSSQDSHSFTLLFLDLDMFKDVNDSLGHAIGDLLLIEVSKRLVACISDTGSVSRLGGDEFVVILPEYSNRLNIDRTVEFVRKRLSYPFIIARNEINITTSIGVTRFPADADNAKELVMNGDQAMYHSKRKGRNCFSYFTQSMQKEAQYKASLIKDLRVAVYEKAFKLNYQPVIDLKTNTITKAEALIRWNHADRGFVPPCEFIPLAEEAGLINVIGDWTFKEATDFTAMIHKAFNNSFQMTINTSPLQYKKKGMKVSSWQKELQNKGLKGEHLVVEITEGVLMEMSNSVKKNLFKLRDLNISIAIDDFGTGYSSLAYLNRFDIDYLKIDQSFVKNLSSNSNDHVLVEAIVAMAHKLGVKVIAEGIETEAQKNILVEAGCDFGQGYYFSKPLTEPDFLNLLKYWEKISDDKNPQKQLPLAYMGSSSVS